MNRSCRCRCTSNSSHQSASSIEGEAEHGLARTVEGEIGFQAGHIPFVGTLLPASVKVVRRRRFIES